MYSAQRLKTEMELNAELADLLDVLKGIAASQFRILAGRKDRFSGWSEAFRGFFRFVDFRRLKHPFIDGGSGKLAIVLVTSDEGFMGGLNARVIRTALTYPGAENSQLLIIGRKGADYLRGIGRSFREFSGPGQNQNYDAALQLRDYIIKQGLTGQISRLIIIYPRPLSFTAQRVEIIDILPCRYLFDEDSSLAPQGKSSLFAKEAGVIVESSLSSMVEYLAGLWIRQVLLQVFEDSKLAEFSARTVHLEQSHQNLQQRGKRLRLQYFRSHHELIDKGMRESFSAQIIRNRR
ncbi:MAG: F0F1 ATP synthase subunit gamma [Candidatus Omnitrophota bacterium]